MALGGVAGICTTFFVHSFDVVRVQMQIDSEGGAKREFKGFGDAVRKIYARAGWYTRRSGTLFWSNCRLAATGHVRERPYGHLFVALRIDEEEEWWQRTCFAQKLGVGMFSGAAGDIIGNPSEIALVRMGADAKLPKELQRGYKNSIDCVIRMAREEGVTTLWRGGAAHCTARLSPQRMPLGYIFRTQAPRCV